MQAHMSAVKNYPRNYLISTLSKAEMLGVPPAHYVCLSYPVNTTWTATAYEASYQFALNDLFDPDYTGAGGQPTYFDQWAVLYSRYRVLGCRVDLTFDNSTSSSIRVVAMPTGNTTILTSLSWAGLAGGRGAVLAKTLTDRSVTMKHDWWVDEVQGVSLNTVYSETNYAAAVTAGPTSRCLVSFVAATGGSTDAVRVFGVVKYVARLEVPTAPNISYRALRMAAVPLPIAPSPGTGTTTACAAALPCKCCRCVGVGQK